MSERISREASKSEDTKPEIAGVAPEIIVIGTKDKPYFEIKYFDPSEQCVHIGFGSYCLDFVFDWLKEYFGYERSRINEAPTVTPEPTWISVKDRLAENREEVLLTVVIAGKPYIRVGWYGPMDRKWYLLGAGKMKTVTHWMPLPEPPEEGNADG